MVKDDAIIVVGMVIVIIVSIIGVSWLISLDTQERIEIESSLITEGNATEAKEKQINESSVLPGEMEEPLVMVHQRGYHQFLWSAEDLVELTPGDRQAIRSFLKQEFGIEVNFSSTKGKLRGVNRIDSDYVFYSNSDSSKRGIVWSQKDVKAAESETIRFFAQTQIKGSDGRYIFVNWDDFIVTVSIGHPGVSFIDTSGDGGSSSGSPSGGGSSEKGPSPSPPIGGELPPSPPIGEGPSPSPPIGGGPSPPPSV